jgi:tetratricopeptide (TPR) repeat protein
MKRNLVGFLSLLALLSGCAGLRTIAHEGQIGTAINYVESGSRLLEKGYLADAEQAFDLAIQNDPKCSSAYRGKALVALARGGAAGTYLKKAMDTALTNEDKALAHVGFMMMIRHEKKTGWLELVKGHFMDAVLSGSCLPEAFFELGLCFKEAYDFSRAREAFQRVSEMKGKNRREAERELTLIHKIKRANPKTGIAVQWSLRPSLTRAEFCAILVEEAKLPTAMSRLKRKISAPSKSQIAPPGHPLAAYVETVAEMDFSGLSSEGAEGFGPDRPLTRKDFVLFLSDLIARISGANSMDTVFGEDLLEREAHLSGITNTVGGADALFVLKKIREKYPIFNDN